MSKEDLKKLVLEMRGKKPVVDSKGPHVTGAPENYMPRPTKGEASDLKSAFRLAFCFSRCALVRERGQAGQGKEGEGESPWRLEAWRFVCR